mmetsp:Transcript_92002/g.148576  ORF Transcript_92002/g.148576 Transcript_92002/m.148576 type:complete len:105 (-) Transcript_92002:967-1281(-)
MLQHRVSLSSLPLPPVYSLHTERVSATRCNTLQHRGCYTMKSAKNRLVRGSVLQCVAETLVVSRPSVLQRVAEILFLAVFIHVIAAAERITWTRASRYSCFAEL